MRRNAFAGCELTSIPSACGNPVGEAQPDARWAFLDCALQPSESCRRSQKDWASQRSAARRGEARHEDDAARESRDLAASVQPVRRLLRQK